MVGFVVPTERRRNRLVASFHEAGIGDGLFFWIVDAAVVARTVLVEGWTTVRTAMGGETAALVEESPFAPVHSDRADGHHGHAGKKRPDDGSLAVAEQHE